MAETETLFESAEIRHAPETCSVETAAVRLGIGRSLAYQMAREGRFPVPIIRAGRKIVVPTRSLDRALGIECPPALAERSASSDTTEPAVDANSSKSGRQRDGDAAAH